METSCDSRQTFICKRPAVESVYRISTDKLPWRKAEAACRQWGGHLAQVDGVAKQNVIEKLIDSSTSFWIGMEAKGKAAKGGVQKSDGWWKDFDKKRPTSA